MALKGFVLERGAVRNGGVAKMMPPYRRIIEQLMTEAYEGDDPHRLERMELRDLVSLVLSHVDSVFRREWHHLLTGLLNRKSELTDDDLKSEGFATVGMVFPSGSAADIQVADGEAIKLQASHADWGFVMSVAKLRSMWTYEALQELSASTSFSVRRVLADLGKTFTVSLASREATLVDTHRRIKFWTSLWASLPHAPSESELVNCIDTADLASDGQWISLPSIDGAQGAGLLVAASGTPPESTDTATEEPDSIPTDLFLKAARGLVTGSSRPHFTMKNKVMAEQLHMAKHHILIDAAMRWSRASTYENIACNDGALRVKGPGEVPSDLELPFVGDIIFGQTDAHPRWTCQYYY